VGISECAALFPAADVSRVIGSGIFHPQVRSIVVERGVDRFADLFSADEIEGGAFELLTIYGRLFQLTGSRGYFAMASDGVLFKRVAQLHPSFQAS